MKRTGNEKASFLTAHACPTFQKEIVNRWKLALCDITRVASPSVRQPFQTASFLPPSKENYDFYIAVNIGIIILNIGSWLGKLIMQSCSSEKCNKSLKKKKMDLL